MHRASARKHRIAAAMNRELSSLRLTWTVILFEA